MKITLIVKKASGDYQYTYYDKEAQTFISDNGLCFPETYYWCTNENLMLINQTKLSDCDRAFLVKNIGEEDQEIFCCTDLSDENTVWTKEKSIF